MAINTLGTMASYATKNNPTFTGTVNWASAALNVNTATVATSQTTTSTSYADLSTVGPSVTLTTGTKVLVIVSAAIDNNTIGGQAITSAAVSGATTLAASDTRALINRTSTANYTMSASYSILLTGLTAGSNTFTMKYRVAAGTGAFQDRTITVIDMGS